MTAGSMWLPNTAIYIANLQHDIIREEYNAFRRVLGIRHGDPMSDRQRRDFDRLMVKKYAKKETPPERTRFVLQGYDILDR